MGWFTKKLNTRNNSDALDVSSINDNIKQYYTDNTNAFDAAQKQKNAPSATAQNIAQKQIQKQAQKQAQNLAYGALGYVGLGNGTGVTSSSVNTSLYTLVTENGKEIVKVEKDGSVTWPNGEDIDAAAKAFGKSLYLGSEKASGVTEGMKQRTRDAVFDELIKLIDETGTITSVELTRYWEAAKIMDKLKGVI